MNEFPEKPGTEDGSPVDTGDERRSEPRLTASGLVQLHLPGPGKVVIPGRLRDRSTHGMRVGHMYPALESGTTITIEEDGRRFPARVVWNRISEDGVESGFYVP